MSSTSCSQLISNTLYSKRFSIYTFNLVCGLDEDGNGVVYGYDAIGSFEKQLYGSSSIIINLIIR